MDQPSTAVVGSGWSNNSIVVNGSRAHGLFDQTEDYLEVHIELRDWSTFHFLGDRKEVNAALLTTSFL